MSNKIKIQRVDRGKTKSFYVNLPTSIAEAAQIKKGEEMEWLIENKDTLILRRVQESKPITETIKQ